ncbi:MAG: FixH family protein [Granulosicoccaceae bacterium]
MKTNAKQHYNLLVSAITLVLCLLGNAVAATSEPPPWSSVSRNGQFTISLGPQDGHVRINTLQSWVVTITDKFDRPVTNARVLIDGGMRAHGHGLPTKPQITQHLGEGRYLIEGMRLNMAGEWTLLIGVELGGQRDIADFDFEIDY